MNSSELFALSRQMVPGGVHSPVRAFKGLHTTPRFIQKAAGAKCWDVEGREYLDFCMSFGPLILGHQNPRVKAEMAQMLERGWSYGACEPYSLDLVQLLLDRLPFIEQIRFMNSGTEAVMTALRLARGVTGKNKIIKFNGCYHGHGDSMLIKAGSGPAMATTTSSRGIPPGVVQDTIVVELNDQNAVEQAFQHHQDEIAAVIIEPLPANNGLLIQEPSFLQFLREITRQTQSLLIFDEVISGFRVAFGGMVELTGIIPDIVAYGKIIGGGMPVGAVGAKREVMEHLAPVGEVYQAGTLSANPLAMVAGRATLQQLTAETYQALNQQTEHIVATLNEWLNERPQKQHDGKRERVVSHSSLFWIAPGQQSIRAANTIPEHLEHSFYQIFQRLLKRGIYLAPNAYEVGFVSVAHDRPILKELQQRLWN